MCLQFPKNVPNYLSMQKELFTMIFFKESMAISSLVIARRWPCLGLGKQETVLDRLLC